MACRICLMLAVSIGLAGSLSGCAGESGPPRHTATGTVTLDDQPLAEGEIQFDGTADGLGIDAGKIRDGKYTAHVQPGNKKVRIVASRVVPGKENAAIPGTPVYEDLIPAKYNQNTELAATVTAEGPNSFDFSLKSK